MEKGKVVTLEDRVPKIKQQRKHKTNRRLIIYLSLFFILLFLIIYSQSSFSKVSGIAVDGNVHVLDDEIIKISEITNETSIWRVNVEKVSELIQQHKEISGVEVQRKFPNSVEISIEEYKRVAYIYESGNYYPVMENGKMLSVLDDKDALPDDAPLMMNWKNGEMVENFIVELIKLPESIIYSISEIHHTPTDIDPYHITMFMNDGFEVSATIRDFSRKMVAYPSIIEQLDPSVKGIINLEVGTFFKPYESGGEEEEETDESDR
ncbi:cell division protein FtsQ [Bacillus sp. LL01]|uniref:cell division protein FtsQ/DivIB n=1 Tax=Bacillus sp. LL01 TaxID=1665556 RepID=UPI00064D3CE2|nr:FtsQ-type POTRA domain-containing protein [Bacillus sp. LL01]KMJ58545.1 cell division protein FtsQ [Bacillus sp. LL01]